jgi:hypothetical protein
MTAAVVVGVYGAHLSKSSSGTACPIRYSDKTQLR